MNRLEANISLFAITFFASVQYIFLAGVPADLSHFAFLFITNLIGFLMTFAAFFGELFRLDSKQIIQSMILSGELIGFNLFMLMGVKDVDPAVTSAVLSSYFVLILIFEAVLYRKMPGKNSILSVIFVLTGLFFMSNLNIKSLLNVNILYLLASDVFFAIYIMNVGSFASSSNPSILAMGQMFFCCIFSFILWLFESFFTGIPFRLPVNKEFWVGVVYISFFIRGLFGIIQIYAQRYVSPLNTSLIFASEVVMTMIISPVLSTFLDVEPGLITPMKILGSILIISGLVIMEPDALKFLAFIKKIKLPEKNTASSITTQRKILLAVFSSAAYIFLDVFVRMTEFMPDYAGIKNSLPFITGLFFGIYGTLGNLAGCIISSLISNAALSEISWECWCVLITGLCMYYGWHIFSRSHRIIFKRLESYLRYALLALLASILCFKLKYMCAYFITSMVIGLPVNILFGSLLYIEPVVPSWCKTSSDADLELDSTGESLERVNNFLQDVADAKGITLKRVFELQSCLEELSIRIFGVIPDAKIKISVIYDNAISMRLNYAGKKYNPFKIAKGEDILDIMSLNIIKHRALRASFMYSSNENKIHVVI